MTTASSSGGTTEFVRTPYLSTEDKLRLHAYIETLGALADVSWAYGVPPNKNLWAIRHQAMRSQPIAVRINWIRWVEANAKNIPWCGELVAALVTHKLTQGEV